MDDKDSQKSKVRKRIVKESVERVRDRDNGNGGVKSINERTEEIGDEPAKETGISPNDDDVASEGQSSTPDWENLFRISIEFDGIAVFLFVFSFLTRTFRLSQPKDIVFDELHYGKYIKMYNEKTFFFDQHPPLGKQLIAAVTNLVGFGNYTFSKIGASYSENVPILAMRFVPALCGSLLAPVIYALFRQMKFRRWTATIAGLVIVLDNALLTQSRFVLMESMLLLFSAMGMLFLQKFQQATVYRPRWFYTGAVAGAFFTFALSVKYVAFYSCCLAGFLIFNQLWSLLSERTITNGQLIRRSVITGLIFSIIPITFYLGIFYTHLNILNKAGPHDNTMTSAFQASLEGGLGSITKGQPFNVVHGSQITLRHTLGRPCWLHSHAHLYPVRYSDKRGSSHQQQVSCYSFKDVNNWWIVKRPSRTDLVVGDQPDPIKHGDEVHLVHGITSRALNSHDVAAPMTPQSQEVTCYIDYNISMPAQILWRVDIINKDQEGPVWHAITSQVRLIHVTTGLALRFTGRQLGDWGFNQHEIVADRVINQDDTVWNVEEHRYTKKENADQKEIERQLLNEEMIPIEPTVLSFLEKFKELQLKMLFYTDSVNTHMYSSAPMEWPLLNKGIAYWVDQKSNAQIHLLGNVVLWYSGSLSIFVYSALLAVYLMRRRRHVYDLNPEQWNKFTTIGLTFLGGYLVHFLPYLCVERTLFLHNYLPALIYKLLLLCAVIEHLHDVIKDLIRNSYLLLCYRLAIAFWLGAVILTFCRFAPLSYGLTKFSADDILALRWKDTWDFIMHRKL